MGPCLSKSTKDDKAPDSSEVNIWLNDNGLGEYTQKFKEKGWDEISLLLEMSDSQIDICIQKPGHVVKFKKALENLNRSMGKTSRRRNSDSSSELGLSLDETSYAKMKERDVPERKRFRPDDSDSGEGTPVNSLTYKNETQTIPQYPPQYLRVDIDQVNRLTAESEAAKLPKSAEKYKVPRETKWDSDSTEDMQPNSILHYNSEPKSAFKESAVDSFLEENRYPSYLSEITTASRYTTANSSLSDDGSLVAHASKSADDIAEKDEEPSMEKKHKKARRNSESSEVSSISTISRERSFSDSGFANNMAYNHIRDESDMIVKWHEKKDQLYVETETCRWLKCILEEINWATLLGKSGDGKSATVAHIMLQYRDKGFEPMYINTAFEWNVLLEKRKVNDNLKHIVVIDDMFGGCIVDKHKSDQWIGMFDEMVKMIKESTGTLKVVCTSRRYVFSDVEEELKNFKFFDEYYIVDLTTEEYMLTGDEKSEILDKYVTEYAVPDDDRLNVRVVNTPHGFPHCVEMFCANKALRKKKGASFFDDPVSCVKEEILDFKDSDTVKYVVLLLVLLKKNHLQKNYFESIKVNATQDDKLVFKTNYIDLEDDLQTLLPDVYDALDALGHSYLTHGPDGTCCFSHESLLELVAYLYISVNPTHAIDILDFSYILAFINDGRVKSDSLKDTHRAAISRLPIGSAQALAKRITRELKQGNMTAVGYCNAWKDQSFVREWINYVTTKADSNVDLTQVLLAQAESTDF